MSDVTVRQFAYVPADHLLILDTHGRLWMGGQVLQGDDTWAWEWERVTVPQESAAT